MNNIKIKVSIISLEDCTNRRKLLIDSGFPSEYVDNYHFGIDRRNKEITEIADAKDITEFQNLYSRDPKCGELGCLASHLDVYKSFLESREDYCLVLEDDNLLTDGFDFLASLKIADAAKIIEKKKCKSFIINLGLPIEQINSALKQKVNLDSVDLPINIYRVLHSDSGIWRANAYLINRRAAANIINSNYSKYILADDWSMRKNLNIIDEIFVPSTPIFYQGNIFATTIQIDEKDAYEFKIRNKERPNLLGKLCKSLKYRIKKHYFRITSSFTY